MNRLDRWVQKDRRIKYKRLRKLRKARDMASKHVKFKLLLSKVFEKYRLEGVDTLTSTTLAKDIVDNSWRFIERKPLPPPPRSNRSFT